MSAPLILSNCLKPFLLLLGITVLPFKSDPPLGHAQLKALFLYNFTQFVEWPPAAFPEDNKHFVIGLMGEDPFGASLTEIIEGENVNGHSLIIRNITNKADLIGCHILFMHALNSKTMSETILKLNGKYTLTVSDHPDFLEAGGMIKFVSKEKKLHFQINPEASNCADLKISSKLLRLSEIVTPAKE